MGSVIVKGVEMPKNCQECGLYIEGACYAKGYRDYRSIMDTAKPDDCPLIELPPHGRLGDLDELKTAFPICDNSMDIKIASVRATINHAPTIIEAEGSET